MFVMIYINSLYVEASIPGSAARESSLGKPRVYHVRFSAEAGKVVAAGQD